jgi:hypothetical protein
MKFRYFCMIGAEVKIRVFLVRMSKRTSEELGSMTMDDDQYEFIDIRQSAQFDPLMPAPLVDRRLSPLPDGIAQR